MNLTIVADENMEAVAETMGELGSVHLVNGRELQRRHLREADVLLVRSVTRVNKALLESTPVRFVGTATSGFDHIDRAYLRQKEIAFSHAPGSNANSVVEYVLGVIALVDDKLEQLFAGGTVGIVGYGNIGKLLATRLSGLGISYRVYDPWLDEKHLCEPASLAEVLACDVITLHADLTHKEPFPSFHLLAEAELSSISTNSLLINASRGDVVDNRALDKLLGSTSAPTVILDVWEGEPSVSESLLSKVKYGSAHIAGYSLDGKLLATSMLKNALLEHLKASPTTGETQRHDSVPPIHLAGTRGGAALLRALLQHNYDPGLDDRLLREAVCGQSVSVAAANFDRLRKGYRARREVFGADVRTTLSSPADLNIIEAMGCRQVDSYTGGQ